MPAPESNCCHLQPDKLATPTMATTVACPAARLQMVTPSVTVGAAPRKPSLDKKELELRTQRMAQGLPVDDEPWSASESDDDELEEVEELADWGRMKCEAVAQCILSEALQKKHEKLELTFNKNKYGKAPLSRLPHSPWSGLQLLQCICLNHHSLSSLPLHMSVLVNLKKLELKGNRFSDVPSVLKQLPKLVHLDMSNNRLKDIYNLKGLSRLLVLNVSSCNLSKESAQSISGCERLRRLYLADNPLVDLPPDFYLMPRLELLDVSACKLKTLSNHIANLQALKDLNVSKNKLKTLPVELGKLAALEKLKVNSNSLKGRYKELEYFEKDLLQQLRDDANGIVRAKVKCSRLGTGASMG